jgi:large repetitive protein
VTFGTQSTPASAASDGSITVNVPAGATTGKVTVANHWGETGTSTSTFTVITAPNITTFSPGSGTPGSSVTINGTGFTGTSAVKFGTVAATFTVTGDRKITAHVPSSLTAGPYTIHVTNIAGTADSASDFVVVTAPATISSFTPSDGPASSQAQSSVVIHGTNLAGATSVKFNGKVATLVGSDTDTEIDVTVPAGATTGKISVTTPKGTVMSTTNFVVDAPPKVTSFTPSAGIGESVTISGSGFLTKFNGVALDNDTSVSFNGTDATADETSVTDASITVNVPDGATSGPITVTNGHGESFTTTTVFTVIQPPTISSFSPTSGAVGDVVTITGSHLSGTTEVDFTDGVPAQSFEVDSDSQILAIVPAGAQTGPISVVEPHGSGISSSDFTVTP